MTADETNTIRDLRSYAAAAWRVLAVMFGRPDDIIRKGFVSLAEHREISGWLRHLEHFVRRILLALALDIFVPALKPSGPRPQTMRPAFFRRRSPVLNVLPGQLQPHRQAARASKRKAPRCAADTPVRAANLGRRLEALRHALAHIDASALRLARTIHRRLHAPPRGVAVTVRLTPWRAPSWRRTVAAMTFEPLILRIEKHLPEVFIDPG